MNLDTNILFFVIAGGIVLTIAGWDAGSAVGASIGSDMSWSTFTGSADTGSSSGMDSGSSGT